MTISGFPLGPEEDMNFHRRTGEQIPKSSPTGRMSPSQPNMQQLPICTSPEDKELLAKLRAAILGAARR